MPYLHPLPLHITKGAEHTRHDIFDDISVTLYVAVILANVMVNSCSPLFMEMTCETAYPVGEGLSTGFLGMLINLGAASFLAIDQVFVTGRTFQNLYWLYFKHTCIIRTVW